MKWVMVWAVGVLAAAIVTLLGEAFGPSVYHGVAAGLLGGLFSVGAFVWMDRRDP